MNGCPTPPGLNSISPGLKTFVAGKIHLKMSLGELICRMCDVSELQHWDLRKEELHAAARCISTCVGWRLDRLETEIDELLNQHAGPGDSTPAAPQLASCSLTSCSRQASSTKPTAIKASTLAEGSVSDSSLNKTSGHSATAAMQAMSIVTVAHAQGKFDSACLESILEQLELSHSHALDSVHAAVKALELLDWLPTGDEPPKTEKQTGFWERSARRALRDHLLWRLAGLVLGLDSQTAMDAVIAAGDVGALTRHQIHNTFNHVRDTTASLLREPAHGSSAHRAARKRPGTARKPAGYRLGLGVATDLDSEMEAPAMLIPSVCLRPLGDSTPNSEAVKQIWHIWQYVALVLQAIENVPVPKDASQLDAVSQQMDFAEAAKLAARDAILVKCMGHLLGIGSSTHLANTFWNANSNPKAFCVLVESLNPARLYTAGCRTAANYQ